MDKRFFLALLLTGAVVIGTPLIFPREQPAVTPATTTASPPATAPSTPGVVSAPPATDAARDAATDPRAADPRSTGAPTADVVAPVAADTIDLTNEVTTFRFSTRGAALLAAELPVFRKLGGREGHVVLAHGDEAMLQYRILAGGDTLLLDREAFTATVDTAGGLPGVTFTGTVGDARTPITIGYRLAQDSNYVANVTVRAEGLPQPAFLMTDLPAGFDSQEADTKEDQQHLAYAIKPVTGSAERVDFREPEAGERILQPGPITWAVAKSKYFLVGVLAYEGTASPFAEVQVTGAPRVDKVAVRSNATVIAPLPDSGVRFELYAGPQEWKRLVGMGRDFQNTNPYGGFANAVVQPFATIVMRVLLWMKATLQIEYGWILVIFGIAIRMAMWPLNTRMMRSSMQMQRIAPEVQAAQAKHKGDPEKQREAVMKIYSEAGVSPFAALSGCLPMLLPMPILFALFFVFRNTIEFRGVSFLWLADLSLKDPYYIVPLAMGASMYALSKIGMRNVPPNPQTKMMAVLMPVIMTVALLNFASGLNLYYAVQNLAALPQQWLIANERAKARPAGKDGKTIAGKDGKTVAAKDGKTIADAAGGGARKKR